jgi:hypothetical protein
MDALSQLSYVYYYFARFNRRHDMENWSVDDTYMAILWPLAIGKPSTFPLFVNNPARFNDSYDVNRGLDSNRDGIVTKAEAAAKIRRLLTEGQLPANARAMKDY